MRHNCDPRKSIASVPPVSPQLLMELENLQHRALIEQPAVSQIFVLSGVL